MNKKNTLALVVGLSCSIQVMADTTLTGGWQIHDMNLASSSTSEAIEKVVKEMNFFVRSIARSRLEEEAQVCQRWSLLLTEQTFKWQCADGPQWTVNTHSNTKLKGDDGREIQASFSQVGDRVSVTLQSERGTRTHSWEERGNEMKYFSTLMSEKLPKPLEWSLDYQRLAQ